MEHAQHLRRNLPIPVPGGQSAYIKKPERGKRKHRNAPRGQCRFFAAVTRAHGKAAIHRAGGDAFKASLALRAVNTVCCVHRNTHGAGVAAFFATDACAGVAPHGNGRNGGYQPQKRSVRAKAPAPEAGNNHGTQQNHKNSGDSDSAGLHEKQKHLAVRNHAVGAAHKGGDAVYIHAHGNEPDKQAEQQIFGDGQNKRKPARQADGNFKPAAQLVGKASGKTHRAHVAAKALARD